MKNKDYNYKKKFKFSEEQDEYAFQLTKRNWKWLWLLLLLPFLLLFVRCERDINVHTVDSISDEGIPDVGVSIDYTAYYLYKDGYFFANEAMHRDIKTDENGKGQFEGLPCSVFSYIFYALSDAVYNTSEECHKLDKEPENSLFHCTWNKELKMKPKTEDLELTIVDRETIEPLAGATVLCEYMFSGENHVDSFQTDPAGICYLKNIPSCGNITLSSVYCYGYADTTNVRISIPTVLAYADSSRIMLTPLKQRFSYFIKNRFTKEPVPGATVEVILTSSNGTVLRGKSITNVDGKGIGVFDDAFVLANVELKASKYHFKDGLLEKQHTVEQFAALPESGRTVYLRPDPYMVQFQNVDSITGGPISGVRNYIKKKSISGNDEDLTETSNRNGIFYVKAMEEDRIDIHSELSPYYASKNTVIDSFKDGELVKMQPRMTDLAFRTIDEETDGLLPECTLSISCTRSNIKKPSSSGNGIFTVKNLFIGESISITASKTDYGANSSKIRNAKVIELMNASQERRDIPLNIELSPCDAGASGKNDVKAGTVSTPQSYNMGMNSGSFKITYDTQTACSDQIQIYNHKPGENPTLGKLIFDTGQVVTNGNTKETVWFSNGSVITIVVTTGPSDGSGWSYHISCPQ